MESSNCIQRLYLFVSYKAEWQGWGDRGTFRLLVHSPAARFLELILVCHVADGAHARIVFLCFPRCISRGWIGSDVVGTQTCALIQDPVSQVPPRAAPGFSVLPPLIPSFLASNTIRCEFLLSRRCYHLMLDKHY